MIDKRISIVFMLTILLAISANAGSYSEDFEHCVTTSATADDKAALARLTFAAFSLNPIDNTMNIIPDERLTEVRHNAIEVYLKLITDRCREESRAAIVAMKSGQPNAFGPAFEALGQAAGRYLAQDQRVLDTMTGVATSLNGDKRFVTFFQEALKPSKSPK